MTMFIALLSFLLVTAIVLSGFYLATADNPVGERLRTLGPAPTAVRPGTLELPILIRGVQRAVMTVGKFGFGGDEKDLTGMLAVAGIRTPNAAFFFLGLRTLLSFGPAVIVLTRQIANGASTP